MRELDKLLHEIPLDELMGDTKPEFETKPIIFEKSEKSAGAARVKTHRLGAVTAVAAAMALVIGGGMYWGVTHNKLSPFSFLSKNGVNSPIENQNRTLIEQYIEHMGGDASLLGDSLVVFETPIAPEHYLGEVSGLKPDFQILGYSYSGDLVNIYVCLESTSVMIDNIDRELYSEYEQMIADFENRINEAIVAGDDKKVEEIEKEREIYLEEHDFDRCYNISEHNETEELFSDMTYVALKNSDGNVIYKQDGIPAYERIGDYNVGSMTIAMSEVTDKKVTFECTYAGTNREELEIPLDKYKMTVYNTISCDEEVYSEPDMHYKEAANLTVKSISYDKGFVDVVIEKPKDYELYDANVVGIYNESGNFISTPTYVTAVYENGTAPIRLTRAINHYVTSQNDTSSSYTMHFSALDAPLAPERIDYFIVGSKRIYVKKTDKASESYGVCYDETDAYNDKYNNSSTLSSMHYYFKADIPAVKELLEGFKSSCEKVGVNDYNTYLYQGGTIIIYGDDGKCESYSARVNLFDILDEEGNISPAVKTLLIDGEYYKLSDEEITTYETLCRFITNKTPKGEEK